MAHIKAEGRGDQYPFFIAGTLFGLEFISAVGGADGDRQGIYPCFLDKVLDLLRLGIDRFGRLYIVFNAGQDAYQRLLQSAGETLTKVKDNPVPEAEKLLAEIERFCKRKISRKPEQAAKDAREALRLAAALEKVASVKAANEKDRKALAQLRGLAGRIRAMAASTAEAGDAAAQAKLLMTVTQLELAEHATHDAGVGFANAPAAANLKAAAQIGQPNVKAIWAYQGSRPCLFGDLSAMVHGAKVRAVNVETGKVAWERGLKYTREGTRRPVTPPALAGGKLYLGTADGRIICLDPRTGKTLWQSKVGGRILFEPAVADGCVYAATSDGTLIRLETGDKTADGWHMWGGSAGHNGAEP